MTEHDDLRNLLERDPDGFVYAVLSRAADGRLRLEVREDSLLVSFPVTERVRKIGGSFKHRTRIDEREYALPRSLTIDELSTARKLSQLS